MKKLLSLAAFILSLSLIFGPAAQAEITLKMAGQYAPEHTTTKLQQEFADRVAERTKGEVKVRVFPANQLGDYTQVYEELRRGTIDMATISVPSQFDTRLEASYLHYLALDYEDALEVYGRGSPMFKITEEVHESLGVKFLGFNVEGLGGFGMVKLPENLDKPNAPRNVIMRVPVMAVFQIPCEDQGFQTVSIPFAELYTALQTGVADGWSGGPAMVNYIQYRDVIKYFVASNNFFENTSYLMSKGVFDKLSPEQQQVIIEEARIITDKSFEVSRNDEEGYLKQMEESGIQVVRFTPEQLQAWAKHCREVSWPKMEERLTKPVIDALLSGYK